MFEKSKNFIFNNPLFTKPLLKAVRVTYVHLDITDETKVKKYGGYNALGLIEYEDMSNDDIMGDEEPPTEEPGIEEPTGGEMGESWADLGYQIGAKRIAQGITPGNFKEEEDIDNSHHHHIRRIADEMFVENKVENIL